MERDVQNQESLDAHINDLLDIENPDLVGFESTNEEVESVGNRGTFEGPREYWNKEEQKLKQVFNYIEKNGQKWEIVTEKSADNKYEIRVKKWTRLPNGRDGWQTQKNGDEDKFSITAENAADFKKGLRSLLQDQIGSKNIGFGEIVPFSAVGLKVFEGLNKEDTTQETEQVQEQESGNTGEQPRSKVTKDNQYEKDYGVELLRDGKLKFYVVKDGEGLGIIKQKLQQIPEFSYLSDPIYNIDPKGKRNIHGFNTPNSALVPGFYLPIPLKKEDREITDSNFKSSAKQALTEIKNNASYGTKYKELLKTHTEDDIVNMIAAYAKSESGEDGDQNAPIGSTELHRWETRYSAYSFSYFHILMEKTADRRGDGPGLRARKNLGLSEGDCYEPKNACKLFLGYCIEKSKDKRLSDGFFFNINNLEQAKNAADKYNGSRAYGTKLWSNIQYYRNQK